MLVTTLLLLFLLSLSPVFAHWHWSVDLLAHFRLQYLVGFVLLTGLFALTKRTVYLSLATFGILLSVPALLPFYFQPIAVATPQPASQELTLLFSNINYGNTDHTRLLERINQEQPHVVAVVEALPTEQASLATSLAADYPYQYVAQGRNNMGVAVYSSLPFSQPPQSYYWADARHPVVAVHIGPTQANDLTLLVMHPPPPLIPEFSEIRNTMFTGVAEYAQRVESPLVVAGDFNSTSWSPYFQSLLTTGRLSDSRQDKGLQTSWPSMLPAFLRISIDHILTNQAVQVLDRQVLEDVGSDHLPIVATLAW